MKLFFATLFTLCVSISATCQSLSEDAQVSIITCGPWQGELYTAFGHNAIRVFDPVKHIDYAFNYGMFDFNQPHFYLNFARGYLYYKLGVEQYKYFEYPYIYFNRYVHEQVLNLSHEQKEKIFEYLRWNALPENKFYRYDYFYNNCATKMHDVVKTVLKDSVVFDTTYIKTAYTIRELTDQYLTYQPWGDLGIDICLGLPMDKQAAPLEYMFLPDFVEEGFDHAAIIKNGTKEPLVMQKNILYDAVPEAHSKGLFQPVYVFGLLMLVVIGFSYRDLKRKKATNVVDIIMLTVFGAIGLLLLLLWTVTDHQAAAKNFNLLWAIPFHLVAAVAFIWQPAWLKKYFLVTMVISVLLLLCWPVIPQKIHFALIPLVIAMIFRSYVQYKLR